MLGGFCVKEGRTENESLKTPFVSLMNHLSRGSKNVSVVRGTKPWDYISILFHILPRMIQQMVTTGTTAFPCLFPRPLSFFPSSTHGSVVVPQCCSVALTWSASEVDSMLISSRSAVSLHICSHFIFRNLSRSSKITPEGKHGAEIKGTHDVTCQPRLTLPMCWFSS